MVGQKGSGKSFIGSLMEKEFGIPYVRVEDWVKQIKKGRVVDDETYLREAFEVIEKGVRDYLFHMDPIVFESTGITPYFDKMLESLQLDFRVTTIGIQADSEICLDRIRKRDQSIHINISDDQVAMINEKVRQKKLHTDYQIVNELKEEKDLIEELERIIGSVKK